MPAPVITLLTDFGHQDPYVGIMKGVILGICPEVRIVDLTHEVAPYQLLQAAFLLGESWPYFPKGAIHVVVVDPGVGTARRPILVKACDHFFIGPDNGVFSMLPVADAMEITLAGSPASRTFHGRDIFAPTAAHLANSVPRAHLGTPIPDPHRLTWDAATVLHIDHFGNVITGLRASDYPGPIRIRVGSETIQHRVAAYAEAPKDQLFLIEGSSGHLEIALNRGSAAQRLGITLGMALRILP
jgi:S-adenosylmethionine hydrolase